MRREPLRSQCAPAAAAKAFSAASWMNGVNLARSPTVLFAFLLVSDQTFTANFAIPEPLALIGSRTKLMQHWADRVDHWLDPKKVTPIKRGTQA